MKTALVTGTTSGIGREIVAALLAKDFTVIAHGRSEEKLAKEVAAWKKNAPAERIQTAIADLGKKRDVVRMAEDLASRFPTIDVIVNNAAIIPKTRTETEDGLEACFATNVLAPFILARRLEPQLRAAAPSRVILFFGGNAKLMNTDDMQSRNVPYKPFTIYSQSKNACALLALEMSKRLKDSGISVFTVLPGLVDTEGMRALGSIFSVMSPFFFRTPAQGARTPVWVATEPGLDEKSGHSFGNLLGGGWRNELKLPPYASDPAIAEKVYALCEKLAGE